MFKKIKKYFKSDIIKIYDNSHYHKNNNNKKHITILIISDKFIQKKIIERHQMIYKLLIQEFKTILYAVSIHTYSVQEWEKDNKKIKHITCKY